MQKIRLLDDNLINKIAAGEVIEKPASVVKELIENSMDAGADIITLELKEAGKSYIRVSDNGFGMSKEDALLSVQRHTTSKIKKTEDLFNINTLGFRGEALASIASVSNLKITTKTKDDVEGFFLEIESGKILKQEKLGCDVGTTIEVSDLFFNTPVRKKYLKDIKKELNDIIDIVIRYALANKDMFIKLQHNGKTILNSPRSSNLIDKILTVYGKETAKKMVSIYYDNVIKINGYISLPSFTRSDKSQQSIFVNGRYVKNNLITEAVYEGYSTLLFHGRHPIIILNIFIDPKELDVNIHPTKKIIKISKEKKIFEDIKKAVQGSLSASSLIPELKIKPTTANPSKRYSIPNDTQMVLDVKEESIMFDERFSKAQEEREETPFLGPYNVLGQLNKTYILAESREGLAIIDQHAAEERVLYEEFMKYYLDKGIKKQKLIKPLILELSITEFNLLESNKELLTDIGFELEDYGANTFLVRSAPYIFERFNKNLILDILSELKNTKQRSISVTKEERIIRFSCRKAIKAGKELTLVEIKRLVDRLEKTKTPYTCPHGRPTIINISIAELERKFKRTG